MSDNTHLSDTMAIHDASYDLQMKLSEYEFNFISEENVASLVDTYLRLRGMDVQNEQLIDQIAYTICLQGEYVTIDAVSKAFSDWSIPNHIEILTEETIFQIKEPTLSMLINPLELVIIFCTDEQGFIFYSSDGKVKRKLWDHCGNRFTGIILSTEAVGASKIKFNAKHNIPEFLPTSNSLLTTWMEIIVKGRKASRGILYDVSGSLCTPLVYVFYKLKISPIVLTLTWILMSYLAAALIFIEPNLPNRTAAAILIIVAYLLDCSDGTLARMTKRQSALGRYLENFGHLTFKPLFITSITFGLYSINQAESTIIWGTLCLFADTVFQSVHVKQKIECKEDTRWIMKIIDFFYPLNPNIFLVGLIVNCLLATMQVWTIAGFALALIIVFFNIVHFSKSSTRKSLIYLSYIKSKYI